MPIKIGIKGIGWKYNLDKLSGKIHTLDSPYSEFLEDCINVDVCPPWKKIYVKAGVDNPNATCGEIIKKYPPKPTWAKVGLTIFDGYLGKDLYEAFLDLAMKNDMITYKLWKELKHITTEERNELREKFRGKLPTVERKL